MPMFKAKDDTEIFYKDWGTGQPVVFCHGWPLNSDAFEDQMLFMAQHGYRCVAQDRRGHGRSAQSWQGNDMDTHADDLAEMLDQLDLKDVILVGHSHGGGQVARYIGRHGTQRVSKAVLIGAVTPVMVKSAVNPEGVPMKVFDEMREKILADRSQFFQDFSKMFYGDSMFNGKVSDGLRHSFWRMAMLSGLNAVYDCVKAFSETDMTADLAKFDKPTLILHGDADTTVPPDVTAKKTVQLIPGALLKLIKGAPHGLCQTHKDLINADLLAFARTGKVEGAETAAQLARAA